MGHYIDEAVAPVLKTLCGLSDKADLPKAVEKTYWRFKKQADRIGSPVGPSDLINIVFASGHEIPSDKERTFLDDVDENLVAWGDVVWVKWRGNKWVKGLFHGVAGGEVLVELADDTGEERRLAAERVRLINPEAVQEVK